MTDRVLRRFDQLHWISARGMRPVFRLWHYPARGAWQTWVLFCSRPLINHGPPLIRHGLWDRAADLDRLKRDQRRQPDVRPALAIRETAIADEALSPLLDEASRLDLPPWGVVHPFTCHEVGEYGIEGYASRPTIWVVWNPPVPLWVRPIARWADHVRQEFRTALDGEGQAALAK